MVLKGSFAALVCAAMLAWSGSSVADEYRPGEFLTLDLSHAVLSPKLLGPAAQFEPVAVQAKADAPPVAAEAKTDAAPVAAEARTAPAVTVVPVRTAKRHVAVRTKLAHRHANPLDAQAFDARIQVWPCKSGGICNWRR
jgi:hypothetical protein